jgi:hypothetical protein
MVLLVSLASVAACAGSIEKDAKIHDAPAASTVPWATRPEPRRGALAPTPSSLTLGEFWPTSICTRGPGVIVVGTNCGCDSRMTCSATQRGKTLDLHVGATQQTCNDCGTFVTTCAVPPESRPRAGSARTLRITIDGKPALDKLELPPGDAPAMQHCYE